MNEVTGPQRVVDDARAHRASFTAALDELADSCRRPETPYPHGAVETNYQRLEHDLDVSNPRVLPCLSPCHPEFKERKYTKRSKK